MQTINKIKRFTNLDTWKQAHKSVLLVYKITETFPKAEVFGITIQMKRAAISISSNIAEGFGRKGYKEKVQFYYHANGSLVELENQLLIARDIGYLDKMTFKTVAEQLIRTHMLLRGLIRKTKSVIQNP